MANIKYRPMEQLSAWLEYRLVTDMLDPPVFRCRLRPITALDIYDSAGAGGTVRMGRLTLDLAIEAVAEWDLATEGVPIPLTPETKAGWLVPLLTEQVEGRDDGMLLGIAIVGDAGNRENFLKN